MSAVSSNSSGKVNGLHWKIVEKLLKLQLLIENGNFHLLTANRCVKVLRGFSNKCICLSQYSNHFSQYYHQLFPSVYNSIRYINITVQVNDLAASNKGEIDREGKCSLDCSQRAAAVHYFEYMFKSFILNIIYSCTLVFR